MFKFAGGIRCMKTGELRYSVYVVLLDEDNWYIAAHATAKSQTQPVKTIRLRWINPRAH